MKKLRNLKGIEVLSKNEQKRLVGGKSVQPANCKCFCYNGSQKVNAYCFSYCPEGDVPGLEEGSTGDCRFVA